MILSLDTLAYGGLIPSRRGVDEEGNSYNPDQITITFKEGLNVRKIAKLISENTKKKC